MGGMLIDGIWQQKPIAAHDKRGCFVRPDSQFRQWVTADGSSEFKAEANRYHLYISYACPWASRTLMFRKLKGLEKIISLSFVKPYMGDHGWEFGAQHEESNDPLHQANYLYEVYLKANPQYSGKVTVPVLWDKQKQTIVNNESSEIIRMLNGEFNALTDNQQDFYPENKRIEIDEMNRFIYDNINNGVYGCGFAATQVAYDEAIVKLFAALDKVEKLLGQQRYLVGDVLTEADWRLFPTLIRFDSVYVGHFKCNLRRIEDYANLSNYLRELYQYSGIKDTVNFKHIKEHYYQSHKEINPTGIVPKGPLLDYDKPHNRN
ncbi:MAG: glutathione S-transferase family protein [Pseudomonadota bacterium]